MTIRAEIIADSISEVGKRITTVQLRYPRFIHAEFMTHRQFSRNASSSRAIPVERLIQDIIEDPVYPSYWGKNQPGMQAGEEHDKLVWCTRFENGVGEGCEVPPREAWDQAREHAIIAARNFSAAGYHKQIVNRLLEPFSHINVVMTSTEFSNFFSLRRHADAQPEIHELADRMWEAMEASIPERLLIGEWHTPYISFGDGVEAGDRFSELHDQYQFLIKLSVARCARVSYLTHEGHQPLVENDLALYDRLVAAVPGHMSPAEHQATPDERIWVNGNSLPHRTMCGSGKTWQHPEQHGNFNGWRQFRKTLLNECL